MRPYVTLITVVAIVAWALPPMDRNEQLRNRDLRPAPPYPEFAFAPKGGRGTDGVCGCQAVTTANKKALTFSRTTAATCSKGGLALTNIQDGDLVSCAANLPRIMPVVRGGAKGILMETAGENTLANPNNFMGDGGGWGTPSISAMTPNAVTAPDGTQTATYIKIQSVDAGETSYLTTLGAVCGSGDAGVFSIYIKSVDGGTGSFDMVEYSGGYQTCKTCTFDSNWTRCYNTFWRHTTAANNYAQIGNMSTECHPGTVSPEQEAYVWGGQCEFSPQPPSQSQPSSFFYSTLASKTRAKDVLNMTSGVPISSLGHMSLATTMTMIHDAGIPGVLAMANVSATPWITAQSNSNYYNSGTTSGGNGTMLAFKSNAAFTKQVPLRAWIRWDSTAIADGGFIKGNWGGAFGVTGAGAYTLDAGVGVEIGNQGGGNSQLNGIISDLCISNDLDRCR